MFLEGQTYHRVYTVDLSVYEGFKLVFKDENPLHTKTDFAEQQGFEGKVMYGNILNGFLSHFIGECLPTPEVIIHSQEIKYRKPVYLNDRLDFKAEVKQYTQAVKTVLFKFEFRNSKSIKVATGSIQIGIL